jgi:ferredoxin
MAYVVTEACIRCKFMDCVEMCPVDCFHEGAAMLVIHPDECIDCGACEPECPVAAIRADTDPQAGEWLELNRVHAARWPVIHTKHEPPADAELWRAVTGKRRYFSAAAAESGTDLTLVLGVADGD